MSREVSKSINKTTLAGRCNEKILQEQWDQEWLPKMVSKVVGRYLWGRMFELTLE